jgi:spore germination protein GerM
MRTTLTLDPDVARLVEDAVHRERVSTKQVINDALRRALGPAASQTVEPYQVQPHSSELRPGVDLTSLNRLADELETDAIIDNIRRAS